ncbi:type II toxin-antitoxin system RelE/ParE family toxin [Xanthomonas sp. WHRI 1810A]|uniref:type II toxin-antitoxin system RelE/ParE family toxin n=1 Tax=Xanthomonas sp. WHRI 1810A TaxID=3161565 RepID=UPI0032E8D114
MNGKKAASADLLAILEHVGNENPEAAQRLKDEIQQKIARLSDHPQLYRTGRVRGTRELVVLPNYLVIYRENTKVISILRILHAARQWPPGNQA